MNIEIQYILVISIFFNKPAIMYMYSCGFHMSQLCKIGTNIVTCNTSLSDTENLLLVKKMLCLNMASLQIFYRRSTITSIEDTQGIPLCISESHMLSASITSYSEIT